MTWGSLVGLGTIAIQFSLIGHIARLRATRAISRRREVALMALSSAIFLAAQTMAREAIRPGPLPRASARVVGSKHETRGDYVATTPEGVYLGVGGHLVLIPERLVDQTTISNAPERKPEHAWSLVQRLGL